MCEEDFYENNTVHGRQEHVAPDNEKSSRDKNREAKKISQVGSAHGPKTREWARCLWRAHSPPRSGWFDDPAAKEIGAAPGSTGTVRGWFYVRTKTGHLKKRTSR